MRTDIRAALAACAVVLACASADAQTYPARPIQVVVPFAGGSASDVVARLILDKMGTSMGQRFVVENRPGAGGNIGTQVVAAAAPDGYTLLYSASGPLAVNKTLMANLGYDPERDFAPITLSAVLPNVIVVNQKLPPKTVAELIDYAKARPKQLYYGSVGNGSSQHLAGAYFEQVTGVQMTHVPYRVTGQMVTDLIAGETQLSFQLLPNVQAALKAGQIRPLAVTSEKRLAALPDVPTTAEVGVKDYVAAAWFALLAPRGTPPEIIARLHKEYSAAIADPGLRERLLEIGAEPTVSSPDELARFISSEIVKWRDVVRNAGITAEGQ
ncbi:Bug family tripartite tricarboxylate transporter substrate binding protein [Rhodoplanes roseus]|uniref:Bug family tripartite tricarboxylate transporter substrate binding protein n=1 Tax=Rhodoplanes roseus TaxID=29409 RepID=UPI001FE0CBC9|nr:tripartite tricarboxylate transporter substrate binding protein [Rhodoplanes roseus]